MRKTLFFLVVGIIMSSYHSWAQNIALNKPVTVSSQEGADTPGNAAVDGDPTTRWSSDFDDPQWLVIDLGEIYDIQRVIIHWEAAYGSEYLLQISDDANSWSELIKVENNTSLYNDFKDLSGRGRYLRCYATERSTKYGYSIYEIVVYNKGGNFLPTVNAGPDQTVALPLDDLTLYGKGTDEDGTLSYAWSQVSGPSITMTNQESAALTLSGLTVGTYVFNLNVVDEGGLTVSDEVALTIIEEVDSDNLALFKPVVVSSNETNAFSGTAVVDGKQTTRWSSEASDAQWLYVDLGRSQSFDRLKVTWEAAYAKSYVIQVADASGGPWQTIRTVTANTSLTNDHSGLAAKGRYVRINGTERATGYGYSIFELEIYEEGEAPVAIPLQIPYVQYLELGFSPADIHGTEQLITQNTDREYTLMYYPGTTITFNANDFRGEDMLTFWAVNQDNDTLRVTNAAPLTVMAYDGLTFHVALEDNTQIQKDLPTANAGSNQRVLLLDSCIRLDGTGSVSPNGAITNYIWTQVSGPSNVTFTNNDSEVTTVCDLVEGTYRFRLLVTDETFTSAKDEVKVIVEVPEVYDFELKSPANGSMVTDTRYPVFTWEAVEGATRYDIYVNTTRTDYDWYASGNLLDRYTKVGEAYTNNFAMPTALVDRWTYKWYVVAITPSGEKNSNKLQFSVYQPILESEADGINIVNGARDCNKNGTIEPYEDWTLPINKRIDDLMGRLTLEEKYKQCFYSDTEVDGFSFSYGVESSMRTLQYSAAKTSPGIPIAFSGDKIHGWKTIFPTQLGLAATRDMNLVYECGNLQRIEHKSFGFTGTLAPLAEVNTKVLYPRFQEGAGENADEVAAMVRALVAGMQGGPEINPHSMLVTMKHWPGQGAGGESILQYDETTIKYHMRPWEAVVDANAASVMPGYNSAPYLDPKGIGANSSKPIIDYLRDEIEFKGFIVTDWLAANTAQSIESMGAGIDVIGGAASSFTDPASLITAIGETRLNEAVRRVLDMKFRLGLFENPYSDSTTWTNQTHHAIALQAARQSITLLKNDHVLPITSSSTSTLVIGGPRASWEQQINDPNVIWQSIYYENPQAKTYVNAFGDRALQAGIHLVHDDSGNGDVAIVVIGEKSYTHGSDWPDKNPNIPEDQVNIIKGFKDRGIPVVTVVISPRPYVLTDIVALSDAVLLTYRGGNGIAQAIAELCFGDFNPSGKLPFQLPRSVDQIGTDNVHDQVEAWDLPYDLVP